MSLAEAAFAFLCRLFFFKLGTFGALDLADFKSGESSTSSTKIKTSLWFDFAGEKILVLDLCLDVYDVYLTLLIGSLYVPLGCIDWRFNFEF